MARIRTIKPEFFRHEKLQDIQEAYPQHHPMIFFVGLWTQCDKNGVFMWTPKLLKLDILPFVNYDPVAALMVLWESDMIRCLTDDKKAYGYIPTFRQHQRITGTEATGPARYPEPTEMTEIDPHGNTMETPWKQVG